MFVYSFSISFIIQVTPFGEEGGMGDVFLCISHIYMCVVFRLFVYLIPFLSLYMCLFQDGGVGVGDGR